jgi:hypothetical protein
MPEPPGSRVLNALPHKAFHGLCGAQLADLANFCVHSRDNRVFQFLASSLECRGRLFAGARIETFRMREARLAQEAPLPFQDVRMRHPFSLRLYAERGRCYLDFCPQAV